MKIPIYTARGTIQQTMPGRQIRARRSIQAEQQAAMASAAPALALTEEVGAYAQTRYKMQVENQLNDAMLDAQEALRERRRELAKDPNYNKVLDGDDPIWDKETTELQTRLRQKVGSDVYALQQFDSRFRQMEQQNRFALRDDIDRRIEIAAAQNRARALQNTEDSIVDSTDLAQLPLFLKGIVQDKAKLAKIGAGNIDVLNAQEQEMIRRAAFRALEKHANEASSGVSFVDQVRAALEGGADVRNEDGSSPLKSHQAVYVYGLMRMLDPSDQATLLKKVGATQTYLEGETIAEKNERKQAELYLNDFTSSLDVYSDQLASGNTLPDSTIDEIKGNLKNNVLPRIGDQTKAAAAAQAVQQLEAFNDFQKSFGKRITLDTIDDAIATFRENGIPGEMGTGIDTPYEEKVISFIENYKGNMEKALSKTGDAIDFALRTEMDGIDIRDVNFAADAFANGTTGLNARLQQGTKIKANNQLDHLPLLTNDEMTLLSNTFNQASFDQQRAIINGINQELGPKSSELYSKLSKDAPMMTHLAGLIELNGINDEASRQIQLGLSADTKIKVSALTNAEGSLGFNAIVLDAFGTLPEKLEQNLRGVTQKSVEAIITYRMMYEGLDPAEIDGDDLRNIVSFALGGSKDGERGGIGIYNERSYFRPANVSDDEFEVAVQSITAEKLSRLPGNVIDESEMETVNTLIEGVLGSDETGIASVGRDSRGYIIYEMYRGEPGMAQAIGTQDGNPIRFTFEDLTTLARIEATTENEKREARQEIIDRSEMYMYRQTIFYHDLLNNTLYDQNMNDIGLDRLDEIKKGERLRK